MRKKISSIVYNLGKYSFCSSVFGPKVNHQLASIMVTSMKSNMIHDKNVVASRPRACSVPPRPHWPCLLEWWVFPVMEAGESHRSWWECFHHHPPPSHHSQPGPSEIIDLLRLDCNSLPISAGMWHLDLDPYQLPQKYDHQFICYIWVLYNSNFSDKKAFNNIHLNYT